MGRFFKGALLRCTARVKVDGVLTDPTALFFWYEEPDGTETTLQYGVDAAVVKEATGIYYVDLSVDEKGEWKYAFYTTGVAQGAVENEFTVFTNR